MTRSVLPLPLKLAHWRSLLLTCVVVLALMLIPELARAQDPPADSAADVIATVPVEIDGDVLFRVRGVSSLTAGDRAQRIREQIIAIAKDSAIAADSLHVVEMDTASQVQAGTRPVMAVVEADARIEQVSRAVLAQAHVRRIQQAIRDYRAERAPDAIRRDILQSLVAIIVLSLVVLGIVRLGRVVDSALSRRVRSRIQSVGIQSFEVVRAEKLWDAVRGTLMVVRTTAVLVAVFLFLGYVLAQFPSTRALARNMVGFALSPLQVLGNGIVANIPSLVFLVVLFFVLRVMLRLIRLFFGAIESNTVRFERFDPTWAQATYKLVRIAVVAFGLIIAYPYIPGSNSAAFQGVSLFIGIVFSLGSSSAIANLIAGYMLIYRRAFKVGDRVKIGDAFGEVIETRLQVTHLRSIKNEELIVPNSQILGAEVMNFSSLARAHGLILHTEVNVGYGTSWRQVEAMLLMAAQRTSGLGGDPRPFVHVKRLGDFSVTYELNVHTANVSQLGSLYTALHRNVLDAFNEHGVQIMVPAYESDPPEPKVVRPSAWYVKPAVQPDTAAGETHPPAA
jgi:small-conductance mechanosensitive channel